MTSIGDRIRYKREQLGMTQEELAKKLGYASRSSVNKVENSRILSNKKVELFADALYTTPAYLMGWEDTKVDPSLHQVTTQRVPLLGAVAAGQPIMAEEDFECYIEVGAKIHCDFCLRVKGDSMINARIHDGDIIFVRQQAMVSNGEIAVVVIDNEATLKRVFYYAEQAKLILQAENPQYEPFVFVGDELENIRIIGKAIAFQSDVK